MFLSRQYLRLLILIAAGASLFSCSSLVNKIAPPKHFQNIQSYQLDHAERGLRQLREIDLLVKLKNKVLIREIERSLTTREFTSIRVLSADVGTFNHSFIFDLRTVFDDHGESYEVNVNGYLTLVASGSRLSWVPYFQDVSINIEKYPHLINEAANHFVRKYISNLNGQFLKEFLSFGSNFVSLTANPLQMVSIESMLTQSKGISGKGSKRLGGIFTVSGSAILIDSSMTSIALDLTFIEDIGTCRSDLVVNRSLFSSDIVDREPVGKLHHISSSEDVKYYFTAISGAKKSEKISHYWFADGSPVANVELTVSASIEGWRTWSRKNLGVGDVANWEVLTIENNSGCIIASDAISVVDELPQQVVSNDADFSNITSRLNAYHYAFDEKLSGFETFQITPDVLSIELSKQLLQKVLTGVLSGLSVDVQYDLSSMPTQYLSSEIQLLDFESIECKQGSCDSDRVCKVDYSHCPSSEDSRNCSACVVRNPFGGCVIRGNDPICEASKAAQNLIYKADRERCVAGEKLAKLDCERLKGQEIAGCAAGKLVKKALCEGVKETVKRIQLAGHQAEIKGDLTAEGLVNTTFSGFELEQDFRSLNFNMSIQARAKMKGRIDFNPRNLGYGLLCISDWSDDFETSLSIKQTSVQVTAGITFEEDKVSFLWNSQTIQALLSPAPIYAIFNDVKSVTNCATGLTLAVLADRVNQLGGGKQGEMFSGKYDFQLKNEKSVIEFGEIGLKTFSETYKGKPYYRKKSLILSL